MLYTYLSNTHNIYTILSAEACDYVFFKKCVLIHIIDEFTFMP